jgi:hypothetical protein
MTDPIILRMPRRTPALYWRLLRTRFSNWRHRHDPEGKIPMTVPQHIEMDTPEGLLSVSWPQPQAVYSSDETDPVGYVQQQDPTPLATLNGVEITVERAKQIMHDMLERRKN